MNATVEVAPTATTNCECKEEWYQQCDFGHDGHPTHCNGQGNPGGASPLKPGCCFNYWWEDQTSAHGVSNLSQPSPDDDSSYLADAFIGFAESQGGAPFLAQLSFHNCHIPFVGTSARRAECVANSSCSAPLPGAEGLHAVEVAATTDAEAAEAEEAEEQLAMAMAISASLAEEEEAAGAEAALLAVAAAESAAEAAAEAAAPTAEAEAPASAAEAAAPAAEAKSEALPQAEAAAPPPSDGPEMNVD